MGTSCGLNNRGDVRLMISALVFFLIAVGCIYLAIKSFKSYGNFIKENNITVTKKSNIFHDGKVIIYDESTNYLWFYGPTIKRKKIGFPVSTLTSCELTVDKETQFKTSLGSTAGRAIVGGLLFGGVGAIIGGVTGKKKGKSLVHEMELLFSTSDLENPYISVIAFKNKKGVKLDSFKFKTQLDNARYWCKFTEAVIERQKAPTN